ncbi:hypothetical protein BSL78_09261 [Apostichopus japonicus]|uniref:Uncharacterized protein n=1 Tax=Stichopus japonicus TaxID=307972 RepID=A0A2G8L0N0_STIJA|nr:hypothetical protein BSL78_09261 [Apostichopus japonicus]
MTTILGPLYREIHWSSTKFLAIPETAVTFFPAMLQNRRRTSSHNRVKHKSNFSPTKYYQSQSKISFIATNSWRNELPQRRQKFFTFSEIKTGKLYFHSKVLFKLLNGSVESILKYLKMTSNEVDGKTTSERKRLFQPKSQKRTVDKASLPKWFEDSRNMHDHQAKYLGKIYQMREKLIHDEKKITRAFLNTNGSTEIPDK